MIEKRTPRSDLENDLQDLDFRLGYGEEHASTEFAIALIKARKDAKMTQEEVADILGVSQPSIARMEYCNANPTIKRVGRVFAAMGYRLVINHESIIPSMRDQSSKENQFIDNLGNAEDIYFLWKERADLAVAGTVDASLASAVVL